MLSNVARTLRLLRSKHPSAKARIASDDFVAWPYIDTLFDFTQLVGRGRTLTTAPIPNASEKKVAIVGAGAAGMCAAYELLKCGVVPTVYEASDRVGGRAWSKPFTQDGQPVSAFAEMGSMRVPLSQKTFWAYAECFGLKSGGKFPDPGVVQTRLYYQNQVLEWSPGQPPPGVFANIAKDFDAWITDLENELYPPFAAWQKDPSESNRAALAQVWQQKFIDPYRNTTFYRAVADAMPEWNTECLSAFGALGVGSGGFGPLYPINMLELARIILLQWEDEQQMFPSGMEAMPRAFWQDQIDVPGRGLCSLQDLGVVKFGKRVQQVLHDANVSRPMVVVDGVSEAFDAVIVATTTRAMSYMGMTLPQTETSPPIGEPTEVAIRDLHLTNSSKMFIRTQNKFWLDSSGNPRSGFPMTILTDELPRAAYVLDYPTTDNGVVLISYTWEDDSTRLQAIPTNERFSILRDMIYKMVPEWRGELEPMGGEVYNVDWQEERDYYGAFKLDYPGQEAAVHAAYFQFQSVLGSDDRGVYIAGDSNSWSGGWTEGALQTGLNAATAVAKRLGGQLPPYNALDGQSNALYDYGTTPAVQPCSAGRSSVASRR